MNGRRLRQSSSGRHNAPRLALAVSAAVITLLFARVGSAQEDQDAASDLAPQLPAPALAWEADRLVVKDPSALPIVHSVVALINAERFGEALTRIETLSRPDVARLQAELAMAAAGHFAFANPEAALEYAESALGRVRKPTEDDTARLDTLKLLAERPVHEWASLDVAPESLVYPRRLLEGVRQCYWSARASGQPDPEARGSFDEALRELKRLFPRNGLVRMYGGERVPWGEGLDLERAPATAPGWAAAMRELRARVDHVLGWWFSRRQTPDGALTREGFGAGDVHGGDLLATWAVTSICCGNTAIEKGIAKYMDGAWTGDDVRDGFARATTDVNEAGNVAADASVAMALFYGNPSEFERCLGGARLTERLHTAEDTHGHRHFRATQLSASDVSDAEAYGMDTLCSGKAMEPAAMVAWYAHIAMAVGLVHDWAVSWSEDAARAGVRKPGGVLPAAVRFGDDDLDGPEGRWWDPGLGPAFVWAPERQMTVLGKALAAWRLTGDEATLDGIRGELALVRKYGASSAEGAGAGRYTSTSGDVVPSQRRAEPGSTDWAAMGLLRAVEPMLAAYRTSTGDIGYDDLKWALPRGYMRFLVSGDARDVEAALSRDLESMSANLPLLTTEAPRADLVALTPLSLLGPLTGSPVPLTEPPSWAVTWRSVSRDFTALVRRFDSTRLSAWVYTFSKDAEKPVARFWRLEPGRYELRIGPDGNGDGGLDGEWVDTVAFDYREPLDGASFTLPSNALCLIEVVQTARVPSPPVLRPDLAVAPGDIHIHAGDDSQRLVAGASCLGRVTFHNIGSAEAQDVRVEVNVTPLNPAGPALNVSQAACGTLPFPSDLRPAQGSAWFEWTPSAAGAYRIEAAVSCANKEGELCSRNNRCEIPATVSSAP